MEATKLCPKCGGVMVIGEECSHVWKPSTKKTFIGAQTYHAYACQQCGYMESYVEMR